MTTSHEHIREQLRKAHSIGPVFNAWLWRSLPRVRKAQGGFIQAAGLVDLFLAALPYILGAVLIWSAYRWIDHSWETTAGVIAGKEQQDALYAKRDNVALRRTMEERDRAQRRKEELEAENRKLTLQASANYQKGLEDGKAELDRAVARVRAGERLRDPGTRPTGANGCGQPAVPEASRTAGGHHGQAGAELSAEASEFLLRLAGEADDRVKQLTAAQEALRACFAIGKK